MPKSLSKEFVDIFAKRSTALIKISPVDIRLLRSSFINHITDMMAVWRFAIDIRRYRFSRCSVYLFIKLKIITKQFMQEFYGSLSISILWIVAFGSMSYTIII